MAARRGAGPEWLRAAVEAGEIHTVRLSFADRLGGWRGKRIPARQFLSRLDQPVGFCDGMIVCDVQCGVHESTPFSNYSTGYPDLHVIPDLDRIHPVGWVPGEAYVFGVPADRDHRPLAVAPAEVLRRAADRLTAAVGEVKVGTALSGRLMRSPNEQAPVSDAGDPDSRWSSVGAAVGALSGSGVLVESVRADPEPGAFTVRLAATDPCGAALASVVTKSALKETARQHGLHATFMTRPPRSRAPSLLTVRTLMSAGSLLPATLAAGSAAAQLTALAAEARALLQPSVNAFKAGTPAVTLADCADGVTVEMAASSEADPATAAAVLLAAIAELRLRAAPGAAAVQEIPTAGCIGSGHDFCAAVERLERSRWVTAGLGSEFIANSVALLRAEAALFADAVTDWETDRYWATS